MSKRYNVTSNFVSPPPRPRVEIIEASPAQLPAPPQTVLLPQASYTDRSKGFTIATGPLAAATGFVVLLIGITAFGVPVLSVAALLLALAGFTATWALAFIIHTFVSPDGALFLHTIFAWGFLRAEQKERHRRYREVNRHE